MHNVRAWAYLRIPALRQWKTIPRYRKKREHASGKLDKKISLQYA